MKELSIYLASTIYKSTPGSYWKTDFKNDIQKFYIPSTTFTFLDPNPQINNTNKSTVVPIDKQLISQCNILVAYIEEVTFGTTMEIFYAHSFANKLVLVIDKWNKFSEDIWLKYHSHQIVGSTLEAATIINSNYNNVIIN
jgi:nucleoside 2-deoxyribosyltransferase